MNLREQLSGGPVEADPAHWDDIRMKVKALRLTFRIAGDDLSANEAWHLESVAQVRGNMCRLFEKMRAGDYRGAWPELEQVEILLDVMLFNAILPDEFAVGELREMVGRWQALYPYQVFASPEMVVRREECSICGEVTSPMRSCKHQPRRVYAGEVCARKITKADIVGLSLVRDPVQKYSVMIPDPDPHDYARVRFLAERVQGPFSRWTMHTVSKLHPHDLFVGWAKSGPCPCDSGDRYADCCLTRPGVALPHDQVSFNEGMTPGLPGMIVRRRSCADGEMQDVVAFRSA
jgi:hypothetical protein